jgi:hypothetical protein
MCTCLLIIGLRALILIPKPCECVANVSPEKIIPGRAIFDPSKKMTLNETQIIYAMVVTKPTTLGESINTSSVMEARLNGTNLAFWIEPETDTRQNMSDKGEIIWLWNVNPKKIGYYDLNLTINTILNNSSQNRSFLRTIHIIEPEIPFWDQFWTTVTLFVNVIAWILSIAVNLFRERINAKLDERFLLRPRFLHPKRKVSKKNNHNSSADDASSQTSSSRK